MIGRLAVIIGALLIITVLVVVSRNLKKQRVIVIEPTYKCAEVIGDGACPWTATPAQYPKSALVRDIEPRGM